MKLQFITVFLAVVLFSILGNQSYAQAEDTIKTRVKLTRLSIGLGGGDGFEGGVGGVKGTIVLSDRMGAVVSFKQNTFEAENLPYDYHSGLCLFGTCTPKDWVNIYSFQVFRELPTSSDKIKMAFELGPSLISHHLNEFTRTTPGWFGSNYNSSFTTKQTAGFTIHFLIDFLLFRWMGFDASLFTNVNPLHSFIGFEIYLNLGIIRR